MSLCSRRVRICGQSQGAVVLLRGAADRELGKWVATWPDELFDLDPGVTLAPGEPVSAMQTHGADACGWTSIPTVVQDAGPSNPLIVLPVTGCSSEVQVGGVAPGSEVTIVDTATASVLGTARGGTREVIALNRTINPSDHLQLSAASCTGAVGPTSAEPVIETLRIVDPVERRLLPVSLELPVRACQRLPATADRARRSTRHRLLPGARRRLGGDLAAARRRWPPADDPLADGESLAWWVEPGSRGCEAQRSKGDTGIVTSEPPGVREISTEPCPGTRVLHVTGLLPSATVRLRADGVDVLETVAAGVEQDIDLAGLFLVAGQRLTVVQRLCHDWSAASPPVAVTVASTREPFIAEPLHACAPVVVVNDVSPGATVLVLSERLGGGEIGRVVADGTSVAVPVAPFLETQDGIVVQVVGCHPAELTAVVGDQVDVPPPLLQQAYVGTHTIVVAPVVPGCTVDVVLNGHQAASATATQEWVDLDLTDALLPEDRIEVVVRLCSLQHRTDPQSPTAPPTPGYTLLRAGGSTVATATGPRVRSSARSAYPGTSSWPGAVRPASGSPIPTARPNRWATGGTAPA